jgi:translation initiation factor 1
MSKKTKYSGVIYSTDPNFRYQTEGETEAETLSPAQQKLRVQLDRKQRKGKEVTLITGFTGSENDLAELAKALKTKCGVGGSTKNGEIIIQGDQRNKVIDYLKNAGYRVS